MMMLDEAMFFVLIGAAPALLVGLALGYMVRDDQLNRQIMPPEDWAPLGDPGLTPDLFDGSKR